MWMEGAFEGDVEGRDKRWNGDTGAGWVGGRGKESACFRGREWEWVSLGEACGDGAEGGS